MNSRDLAVYRITFLRLSETVCLPGEVEYLFQVAYWQDRPPLSVDAINHFHERLLARVDEALSGFIAHLEHAPRKPCPPA